MDENLYSSPEADKPIEVAAIATGILIVSAPLLLVPLEWWFVAAFVLLSASGLAPVWRLLKWFRKKELSMDESPYRLPRSVKTERALETVKPKARVFPGYRFTSE